MENINTAANKASNELSALISPNEFCELSEMMFWIERGAVTVHH